MASGYQQTVAAGSTTPLPASVTPDEMGASVGDGVANLGQQISSDHARMASLLRDQQQDQQSVDFANNFADAQTKLAQTIPDLRAQNSGANTAAHLPAVNQAFDDAMGPALDGITSPAIRAAAQRQIASTRAGLLDREATWVAGANVTHLVTGADQAKSTLSNTARGMTDPNDVLGLETQYNTMVDGFTGIDQDKKTEMKRSGAQSIYGSWVEGLSQTDPNKAVAVLDHGALNDIFEPQQIQTLRRQAEVQVRRLDSQQREALSQQKAQISSAIANVRAQQAAGIVIPDAQLANLQAQANMAGLDTDEFDIGVIRSHNDVNTVTQSWKPQQFDTEIQRLQAEGPNASSDDQVKLHWLQEIAPARKAAFHDNPGGFAAVNGAPPPAVDPDDPSTFAARAQWRAGVQQATGTWTPTLSKDEAQPYQEMIQHGSPADKLRAAQWINQWGGEAPNVLRQLEPNRDSAFAQAVAMGGANPTTMRDALNGPAAKIAMGGDARLFAVDPAQLPTAITSTGQQLSSNATPEQLKAEVSPDALFGLGARGALQARGAQFAQGVRENADNIYASTAQANGWNTFHPGEYLRSIQRAAGGVEVKPNVWRGGFGSYNGQSVLLPADMTQDDFARTISRASPDDFARAAAQGGGAPVYAGGQPLTAGELKAATPVALGGGHYMFKVGNTAIRATHGGTYVIDVGRLPRR